MYEIWCKFFANEADRLSVNQSVSHSVISEIIYEKILSFYFRCFLMNFSEANTDYNKK